MVLQKRNDRCVRRPVRYNRLACAAQPWRVLAGQRPEVQPCMDAAGQDLAERECIVSLSGKADRRELLKQQRLVQYVLGVLLVSTDEAAHERRLPAWQ